MNTFQGLSSARARSGLSTTAIKASLLRLTRPATPQQPARCFAILCTAPGRGAGGGGGGARTRPSSIVPRAYGLQWQRQQRPERIGIRSLFSSSVIIHYVDLPPTYKDSSGLPFRKQPLKSFEVLEIFGPGLNEAAANQLLRILHGRRVAGTLDDPAVQHNTARFTKTQREAALEYLRRTVPVDELINAGLRAEDELAELEGAELKDDAADEESEEAADEETRAKKEAIQDVNNRQWRMRLYKDTPQADVYGVSALDVIRTRNKARQEAELARQEEERRQKEEEEAKLNPGGLQRIDDQARPRELGPLMQKWTVAATSPLREPPSISKWDRLWPSYLFVASLLVGGTVLATYYVPPKLEDRAFPDIPPAAETVGALVLANLAAWALWHVPPLWAFMNRYMMLVPATPRPLSILGAMFSHQKLSHLAVNAAFLWFVGVRLHDDVGRARFLEVYLASGALGYLASMTNIVARNRLHLTTLGASGAIYGVATAYFIMHKFDGFKILGLPPDPYNGIQGLGFIGLLAGINLLALTAKKQTLDVVSHITGMAVGALYGQYFLMRTEERTRARQEGRPERGVFELLRDRFGAEKK